MTTWVRNGSNLAEFIHQTYRLSRRMIRHRRGGELTDGYAVAGREPVLC